MPKTIKLVVTPKVRGVLDLSSVTKFSYQPSVGEEFILSEEQFSHPLIQNAMAKGYFTKSTKEQSEAVTPESESVELDMSNTDTPVVVSPEKNIKKDQKVEVYSPSDIVDEVEDEDEDGTIDFVDRPKREDSVVKAEVLEPLFDKDGNVETTPIVMSNGEKKTRGRPKKAAETDG